MRVSVPLRRAYKLINHGPTTLITSSADDRRNVMTAAWVMAIDFDPARLVAVIAADTLTRRLVETSGEFVVNVPTAKMLDAVYAAGRPRATTKTSSPPFPSKRHRPRWSERRCSKVAPPGSNAR